MAVAPGELHDGGGSAALPPYQPRSEMPAGYEAVTLPPVREAGQPGGNPLELLPHGAFDCAMIFTPPAPVRLAVPHVQQRTNGECLAARAAMCLSYLKRPVRYERLVKLLAFT
ncbi:MAG: hypothetical protein DCC55_34880 [Chloroflexi bacterium]|nr:MAG: hypothetical protein DCC55_34880 [Chloroflexota bacterium]